MSDMSSQPQKSTLAAPSRPRSDRRVAFMCASVVAGMLGLAYASVPLYRMFCQVTGFGGTTQRAEKPADNVLNRTITVRFDANVAPGLAWTFEPLTRTIDVKIGETAMVSYRAVNTSDRETTGSASFNVVPDQSGIFFNKLECFCFVEQTLKPGEQIDMPVQFFVDPKIVEDKNTEQIKEITLSYTMHAQTPTQKPGSARNEPIRTGAAPVAAPVRTN
jgi:cytochrome c oxidase assembly protein subunit 11